MNVMTQKMNWDEWNEVNEEKAEKEEGYEKNQEAAFRKYQFVILREERKSDEIHQHTMAASWSPSQRRCIQYS